MCVCVFVCVCVVCVRICVCVHACDVMVMYVSPKNLSAQNRSRTLTTGPLYLNHTYFLRKGGSF